MDRFLGEQRLLVIAPHADDETIGCGGLIAKVKALGGEVYVQVATVSDLDHYDGQDGVTFAHTRSEELAEAMRVLEVDDHAIGSGAWQLGAHVRTRRGGEEKRAEALHRRGGSRVLEPDGERVSPGQRP